MFWQVTKSMQKPVSKRDIIEMNKDEEMPGNPDIGFELNWRGNSKPKYILNQK